MESVRDFEAMPLRDGIRPFKYCLDLTRRDGKSGWRIGVGIR